MFHFVRSWISYSGEWLLSGKFTNGSFWLRSFPSQIAIAFLKVELEI